MTLQVPGYTELRELGAGATGRVLLARHDDTQTLVAIKHLSAELASDPAFLERFRAEALVLEELRHPNIVGVYEYMERDGEAVLVMELVDGVPLRAMVEKGGAEHPEAALLVLRGSLLGLERAHAAGVVHRDYKPENVLVDREGTSKLLDFGIAVRVGESGWRAGTPHYMAPEQWTTGAVTPRTDVYAATAVFYECLLGQPPYQADDLTRLRAQHENAPIPADSAPAPVRRLLRRGLAKQPEERYESSAAFLADLEDAAQSGYGADWAERGGKLLVASVLGLAALLPLTAGGAATAAAGGTTTSVTNLGSSATGAPAPAPGATPPAAPGGTGAPPAQPPSPPPAQPAPAPAQPPAQPAPAAHAAPAQRAPTRPAARPQAQVARHRRRRRIRARVARLGAAAAVLGAGVAVAHSEKLSDAVALNPAGTIVQHFTATGQAQRVPASPTASICTVVDLVYTYQVTGSPALAAGKPLTIVLSAQPRGLPDDGASRSQVLDPGGRAVFTFSGVGVPPGGGVWVASPTQLGGQPLQAAQSDKAQVAVSCQLTTSPSPG